MSINLTGKQITLERTILHNFPPTVLHAENLDHVDTFKALKAGELVLEKSQVPRIEDACVGATLVESKQLLRGRKQSIHGVRIAQLVLQTEQHQQMPLLVAVKPYNQNNPEHCPPGQAADSITHEWAAIEHLGRLTSDLRLSYAPVGVIRSAMNDELQLLTLYEHGVQSFDNVFWAKGKTAKETGRPKLIYALNACFYATGFLAGAGLSLGDARVKNIAHDTRRSIHFPDVESLHELERRQGVISESAANVRSVDKDIHFLVATLINPEQTTDKMFLKVAQIMQDEQVIEHARLQYLYGAKEGQKRTGFILPDSLKVTADKLLEVFRYALDVTSASYPKQRARLKRSSTATTSLR